jgi:hypothetical protein
MVSLTHRGRPSMSEFGTYQPNQHREEMSGIEGEADLSRTCAYRRL